MQKFSLSYLWAVGVAVISLSSCSRTEYAFNPATPAYLGSTQVTAPAAAIMAEAATQASSTTIKPVAQQAAATPTRTRVATVAQTTKAGTQTAFANKVVSVATKKPLTLLQHVVVNKLGKQVAKARAAHENTASAQHTAASKTGRAAIVALVSILLIVLGGAVGETVGGILALIGIIGFIVGIVMFFSSLINGG